MKLAPPVERSFIVAGLFVHRCDCGVFWMHKGPCVYPYLDQPCVNHQ